MRKFQFFCGCEKSTHDLQAALRFVKLFHPVFGKPDWTNGEGPLTLNYLRRMLERNSANDPEGDDDLDVAPLDPLRNPQSVGRFITLLTNSATLGGNMRLFAKEVRFSGGDKFCVYFSDRDGLPDVKTLLKAIELVKPSHAEVTQFANSDALQVDERYRYFAKRHDMTNRLCIVHWFQWINRQTVANMGGLRHVLKMPCFRIEKLGSGVFWQLTAEHFEPDNPQHQAAQRAAMEHLGIWEFSPEPAASLTYPKKPVKKKIRQ